MARYFCDGSANIGVRSAHCVTDANGKVLVMAEMTGENTRTSNEEEYRGVITALGICSTGDEILTDSKLVVEQVNGRWKVKKAHLQPLCDEAKRLLCLRNATLTWISREVNLAGHIFEK
jgi:ribonuclease HI